MLRTHTCGELRLYHINQEATLCGWVQRTRNKGGMLWIDLRDRYGITQLLFEEGQTPAELLDTALILGREFVVAVKVQVIERDLISGEGFGVFDSAELVAGIRVSGAARYTRKQVGAKGLIYLRVNDGKSLKSSVGRFHDEATLKTWAEDFDAQSGELRLEMDTWLELRKADHYRVLRVADFPLLEYGTDEHDAKSDRDVMIDSPSPITAAQLNELSIRVAAN